MSQITVEELRKELEGLDGDLEVSIERIGKWSENALMLRKPGSLRSLVIMIERETVEKPKETRRTPF